MVFVGFFGGGAENKSGATSPGPHNRAMLRIIAQRGYATVSRLSVRPSVSVRLSMTFRYVFSHRFEYFEANFTIE